MARGKAKQAESESTALQRSTTRQGTLLSHFTRNNSGEAKETAEEGLDNASEILPPDVTTENGVTSLPDSISAKGPSAPIATSTRAKKSSTQTKKSVSTKVHPLFVKTAKPSKPEHPDSVSTPASSVIDIDEVSIASTTPPPSSPFTVLESGMTRHDPILVEPSSPVQDSVIAPKPVKPKPRFQATDWSVPAQTVHAKGDQTHFVAPPLSLPRIQHRRSTAETVSPLVPALDVAEKMIATISSLPAQHREHPAISRFKDVATCLTTSDQMDWTHRFQPKLAAEVLGNESQAIYLRDWLTALSLRATSTENPESSRATSKKGNSQKQPPKKRVLRSFEKKKGRKRRKLDSDEEDNNWIVADDYEEEPSVVGLEEENETVCQPDLLHTSTAPSTVQYYPEFSEWLTNSILLCGPHGSGKTAAVYACAAELGWEVFEVYPGIGRRNGAAIDALIGDVGKNHLVKKSRLDGDVQPKKPNAFNLLGKQGAKDPSAAQAAQESSVNQSLILLEEVDILFKDDVNFWPTMVNIIKECRRPVVFTCNDVSLVPQSDFPLQTILFFSTCPVPLASSYLKVLNATSAHSVDILTQADAEHLYIDSRFSPDIEFDNPDQPLHPFSTINPLPDLRKTILQLQWLSHKNPRPKANSAKGVHGTGAKETLISALFHAELASFADANMTRNVYDTSWALTFRSDAELDEELGHPALSLPLRPIEQPGAHSHYILDTNMRESLTFTPAPHGTEPSPLSANRAVFQNRLLEAIQDLLCISGPLLPRPGLHLDYEPYIRQIVAADDYHEQMSQERIKNIRESHQTQRTRRLTRNSGFEAYVRSIELTEAQRTALDSTRLSQP